MTKGANKGGRSNSCHLIWLGKAFEHEVDQGPTDQFGPILCCGAAKNVKSGLEGKNLRTHFGVPVSKLCKVLCHRFLGVHDAVGVRGIALP